MASFVETATLKVVDQATNPVRKINREIAGLFRTLERFKRVSGSLGAIKINASQVQNATRQLTNLSGAASAAKKNLSMSLTVRTGSVTTAIQRLGALQTKAQQTNTVLQKMGTGPVNVPRQPRTGPRQRNGVPQSVVLDYGGFQGFVSGFMQRLGQTIETAIIAGFKKGTRDVDLAQNRQRILGFTPEQRARNNQIATQLASDNRQFSRAQILAAMGEIAPSVGNDPEATRKVTDAVLNYSQALIAAGATSEEATDNLQKLSKAMGMTGTLLDNSGKFDETAMNRFMEVIVQETITGGREMTPELIAQLAKYSRTTGKTLDQEGWRTLLFLGEDYGSSAGVGLNQLVKQLTGERVMKKTRARHGELGLTGSREVQVGTVDGKPVTETVSTGTVEESLLRTNPAKWVRDILFPIMEKNGYDPTDNVSAAKFAGQITSDRTATDILTTLITNMGEVEQRRRIAEDRGNVDIDAVLQESLTAEWDTATTQLTSAAGEVANSFKSVLIPAITAVSDVARSVAAFVAGDTGEGNIMGGATVAAGGLTAGYAGYKAWNMLGDMFGLKGSAVALNGSAAALTRAAIALGGSGVANDLPGGGNNPKKPGSFPGKILRNAGIAGTIATTALVTDQILLDGAGADKLEKNVNYASAFLDALGQLWQKNLNPEPVKEDDVPQWKKFLFGAASDPEFPGFKEHLRAGFQDDPNDPVVAFGKEVAAGAQEMQVAIDTSANTMSTKIGAAATEFGPTVGQGILAVASQWGAAAGAAFKGAIGNIPVNVNATPAVDTGAAKNGAR